MAKIGEVNSGNADAILHNLLYDKFKDSQDLHLTQSAQQPQPAPQHIQQPQQAAPTQSGHRTVPQSTIDSWVTANNLDAYYLMRKSQLTHDAAVWSAARPNRPTITTAQIDRAIAFEERRDYLFARADQMGPDFKAALDQRWRAPADNGFGIDSAMRTSYSVGTALLNRGELETIRRNGHQDFPGEALSDYRHAAASYATANRFGVDVARFVGMVNEMQGLTWHDIPNLQSRLSGQSAWAFQFQDLNSNEVGFLMSAIESWLPESR